MEKHIAIYILPLSRMKRQDFNIVSIIIPVGLSKLSNGKEDFI